MAVDDPLIAFSRFGLGTRPGDLAQIGADPKAALIAELSDPTSLFVSDAALPSTADAFTQVRQYQMARKLAKEDANIAAAGKTAITDGMAGPIPRATIDKNGKINVPGVSSPQELMNAEIAARVDRVLAAPIGLGERLVAFWANHFAVQAAADEIVRGLAGAFEREAIRPYVLGKFGDMALARRSTRRC